jgi:hypothetical protein
MHAACRSDNLDHQPHRPNLGVLRIVALLLVAGTFGQVAFGQAQKSKSAPCPLTQQQTSRAIDAFNQIYQFVVHEPRCVNCHGGVNPYVKGIGLDPADPSAPFSLTPHQFAILAFGAPAILRKASNGETDEECLDCHDHMEDHGGPTRWMIATNAHAFVNKDPVTLCRQFKRVQGSASSYLAHMDNDEGKANFIATAFAGTRGLDPDRFSIKPKTPSISHEAFMQLNRNWIAAMGGKFQGDEGCGCQYLTNKWSGVIQYSFQESGDEWQSPLQDGSNRSLVNFVVNVMDGVGNSTFTVESKNSVEYRHKVAKSGGGVSIEKEGSQKMEKSGSGSAKLTVDLLIHDDGHYDVVFGGAQNRVIGKQHNETCQMNRCTSTDSDVTSPGAPPLGALKGKLTDPSHVQDSITVKKENLGNSKKGISIESMSVDLYRTSSQ